jgi:hypothetical protein
VLALISFSISSHHVVVPGVFMRISVIIRNRITLFGISRSSRFLPSSSRMALATMLWAPHRATELQWCS